jgi:hypothetical protein
VADFSSTRRTIERRAQRTAVLAAADMRTHVRRAAPYETGETQESVDAVNFRFGRFEVGFTIQATTPQASYTNDGTRPHIIRPRRARALRFRVGGRVVYARVVHHPGTRATHWFDRVVATRGSEALRSGWSRAT